MALAGAGSAMAAEPIKIGLILPMTGQSASTGRQIDAAVKLWMAQNGDTIAGRKVEVILKDDGAVPDVTKRIAQEMIVNDKVAVIAGFGHHADRARDRAARDAEQDAAGRDGGGHVEHHRSVALHHPHQLHAAAGDGRHRRLGREEQDQKSRHAGGRLRSGLRRREVFDSQFRLDGGQCSTSCAPPAQVARFRTGAAEGRRCEARRAVRLPALGPGRGIHEAVCRARPRQIRHPADCHRRP